LAVRCLLAIFCHNAGQFLFKLRRRALLLLLLLLQNTQNSTRTTMNKHNIY